MIFSLFLVLAGCVRGFVHQPAGNYFRSLMRTPTFFQRSRTHKKTRLFSSKSEEATHGDNGSPPTDGKWKTELLRTQLLKLLNTVEPLGSFATTGRTDPLPNYRPKIIVENVGRLGFPLMKEAVEPLKAVATKAPFGSGTETLQDENIRQAWQIEPEQIVVTDDPVWVAYLDKVVRMACKELGFSGERIDENNVTANLYKMLLYESGGHFLPHRDTEKEKGMFGTLVIQLPSVFSGGAITVSHNGETKSFELSDESDEYFKYVAFYADCLHQLHPVESGHRLCLVYNLVSKQPKRLSTHSINVETEKKLQALASLWSDDTNGISRLGYPLEHLYTPDSFNVTTLKGRDEIVRQTLTNAMSASGNPLFSVHLVLMELYFEDCLPVDEYEFIEDERVSVAKVLNGSGFEINITDWAMYKSADGWMVHESEYVDEDEDDGYDEKGEKIWDFWGEEDFGPDGDDLAIHFLGGKKSMFKGKTAKSVTEYAGYLGNSAPRREVWYYAAAIVISPYNRDSKQ